MKKTKIISVFGALALTILLFTSCEKDKPLSEQIIGKWEVTSENQIFTLQGTPKFEYKFYYEADELAFEFTTGGGLIVYQDGEVTSIMTYTLNGSTIDIEMGSMSMSWKNVTAGENTLTWSEIGTEMINDVTYNIEVVYNTKRASTAK
ncbi:MAG TPA: hypothetical protein PKI12_07020 [Bacteroidales bacterium]|nr:hypothetical protein [Bacteroidales bacterium]